MSIDLKRFLNPAQLEAAQAGEGPILILAGAGSGKTRVITYRIVHLIENKGISPSSILAVTFTNKAADQMKLRVRAQLQSSNFSDPLISTFHSLCVRLLRREIESLGYSREFTIYDSVDQLQLIRTAMKERKVDDKVVTARAIQSRVSSAKNQRITPAMMAEDAFQPDWEYTAQIYDEYEKKLRKANALDFDDLLSKTVLLFEKFPDIAEKYSQRFRYIMVDEYQDTNRTQYMLIRHLSRSHGNVCVVGDEDQSIYSWRGADIQNILSFEKDYPDARIVRLEQNYRSTKTILAAASAVVSNNEMRKGKELWTENISGDQISFFEASGPDEEAAFVAQRVLSHRANRPDENIAVLYRTNFLSRIMEEIFRRFEIPYRVLGGFSFYERAEIKDMISYLTAVINPVDSVHMLRIINTPARGIGKTTIDALLDLAAEQGISLWEVISVVIAETSLPLRSLKALENFKDLMEEFTSFAANHTIAELIQRIIDGVGYIEVLQKEGTEEALSRIDNLRELLNAAEESDQRGEGMHEFLDNAALVSDQDEYEEGSPVTLMTVHTAKGLEFPVVFIIGMEDGLFPHNRSINENAALEEERRLFYVGMTRAETQLYLTSSRYRRTFGAMEPMISETSRFLTEIPIELVEGLDPLASSTSKFHREKLEYEGKVYNTANAVKNFLESKSDFKAGGSRFKGKANPYSLGTRVKHAKYGFGTILRTEGTGRDMKLTISFSNYGLKKMIARYASLEPV